MLIYMNKYSSIGYKMFYSNVHFYMLYMDHSGKPQTPKHCNDNGNI